MSIPAQASMNRRLAVGAIAASAVTTQLPLRQRSRAITQRGMIGAGWVQLEGSEAQFSVLASRTIFPEGDEVVTGSIMWTDATTATTFTSMEVTTYEVVEQPPGQGELRVIRGRMQVGEVGEYPFVLNVLDAGRPGEGKDSVALLVGDGAQLSEGGTPVSGLGYSYAAAGFIVGDFQDVDIDIDPAAAQATPSP
jgi:hypothetical protein